MIKAKDKNHLNWLIVEALNANLEVPIVNLNHIDVSDIEDMSYVFSSHYPGSGYGMRQLDISKWNVSRVKDMSHMFSGSNFVGDISQWDVSNVRNMLYMFYRSSFNQDISSWNIHDGCSIDYMFDDNQHIPENYKPHKRDTTKLIKPISNSHLCEIIKIEVEKQIGKNLGGYNRDEGLKKPPRNTHLDLRHIDISEIRDLSRVFYGLVIYTYNPEKYGASFKNFISLDISTWNVSHVTNMQSMFEKSYFTDIDISNWDVSNVTDMSSMFKYSNFNSDISNWNVSNVRNISEMFYGNEYFSQNLSHWDVSNVTNMTRLFSGTIFNGDISRWDVSNVKSLSETFRNSEFNQDISGWNVSKVESMYAIFSGSKFSNDISNWNISSLINMVEMFAYAQFNQDISHWNVSNIKDMQSMFAGNRQFNKDISNWDVSNVENMSKMFKGSVFNQDISYWNVEKVLNMHDMFGIWETVKESYKSEFNQDLSVWQFNKSIPRYAVNRIVGKKVIEDTKVVAKDRNHLDSLVRKEIEIQIGENNLTVYGSSLDLNHIDISRITDLSGLFCGMKFKYPDARYYEVDTTINIDISLWDVSNITDMSSMFASESIEVIGVGNWNICNLRKASNMFQGAKIKNSESLYDFLLKLSKISDMVDIFKDSVVICESSIGKLEKERLSISEYIHSYKDKSE
ncbi:BspA family leucine-rich repeat surface protein [Pseudofrancisella aestuarii]|uniref:BspA family leucine-rich repeat surface protein n=1 Tax=Pseudofrancisella aestuarii TaxID=2670347 RepID=A0ABV9T9L4_9GAMM|nr:BspA family leucine-rich repeat surface protein [Pseudofrancisella aestuarii]